MGRHRRVTTVVLAATLLGAAAAHAECPYADPALRPYKDNYLLTSHDYTYPADREPDEADLKISLQKLLWTAHCAEFYFGYTQKSFWQVYDGSRSRPFRETNYNPEFFILWQKLGWIPHGPFDLQLGLFEHESNGRGDEIVVNGEPTLAPNPSGKGVIVTNAAPVNLSRSWNRVYLQPTWKFGEGSPTVSSLSVKWWYRIPECQKTTPLQASCDDNPDIQDYYGNTELRFAQETGRRDGGYARQAWSVLLRNGSISGTETVQLDWDYQVSDLFRGSDVTPGWYVHLQYFYGYGESLIDYNRLEKKWAIGFAFRGAAPTEAARGSQPGH